jgi:hypothetical protein
VKSCVVVGKHSRSTSLLRAMNVVFNKVFVTPKFHEDGTSTPSSLCCAVRFSKTILCRTRYFKTSFSCFFNIQWYNLIKRYLVSISKCVLSHYLLFNVIILAILL